MIVFEVGGVCEIFDPSLMGELPLELLLCTGDTMSPLAKIFFVFKLKNEN